MRPLAIAAPTVSVLLLLAASALVPADDTAPAVPATVQGGTSDEVASAAPLPSQDAPRCEDLVQLRCAYCSYYLNPGQGFDYRFCDEGRAGFTERFCNVWANNRCPAV